MTDVPESSFWRKCTTCKKPIAFLAPYWICSVSTCNKKRSGFIFCNLNCFDAHIPVMSHREAGAIEMKAPATKEEAEKKSPYSMERTNENEILVVISKVKDYIRTSTPYDMSTSQSAMEALSDHIRALTQKAIENAKANNRKTVMDKDLKN